MGKRGTGGNPKNIDDPTWAKEQFERLTQARSRLPPPGVAVSTELFGEYLDRAQGKAASSSGAASSSSSAAAAASDVSQSTLRAAGFQAHRHSALMATGFEPQRHTMFVEGRPTQATVQMIVLELFVVVVRYFSLSTSSSTEPLAVLP